MRRVKVERGIYRAERTNGWKYEIGWYDETGKQRWKVVGHDLEAARAMRSMLVANGVGGGAKYKALRKDLFTIAKRAELVTPSKLAIVDTIRATSGNQPREAWLTLAALSLAMARRLER